jgi:hypothetical protein
MPVTAKLSRRFYEKFGDELTNELVEWLNQVDAAYRSDLRELNDRNAARLDARFDAFEAKLEARLEAKLARLEGGLLARIGMAEGRLARLTLVLWIATLGTLVAVLKL